MKHLLLCISLVFCSTTFAVVGNIDGEYDCGNTGLRIKGKEAIYGSYEFKYSNAMGLIHVFGNKDDEKESYAPLVLFFDEVTYLLDIVYGSGSIPPGESVKCKKLR